MPAPISRSRLHDRDAPGEVEQARKGGGGSSGMRSIISRLPFQRQRCRRRPDRALRDGVRPGRGEHLRQHVRERDGRGREGDGPAGTAIVGLYCDDPPSHSLFHRLAFDEVWHFYAGDPVRLVLLHPDGSSENVTLGADILGEERVQCVVQAGTWQAGEPVPGGEWAFFGCTGVRGLHARVVRGRHDRGAPREPSRARGRHPQARGPLGAAERDARHVDSRGGGTHPDGNGGLGARRADGALRGVASELTGYCYRMLGSAFEAEDAVQETMLRAWRGTTGSRAGRAALVALPHRHQRLPRHDRRQASAGRARWISAPRREPVALEPPHAAGGHLDPADARRAGVGEGDPAEVAVPRDTIRLAFVAALQHLPPRQRAVLILREVLRWRASEVAELLETSVASVNSALQRARATLEARDDGDRRRRRPARRGRGGAADRYIEPLSVRHGRARVAAHDDADVVNAAVRLWITGPDDIAKWRMGPGTGWRGLSPGRHGSAANGALAFGQYPTERRRATSPWGLQVIEGILGGQITGVTFFLDTASLFPVFGLPATARRLGRSL